MANYGEYQLSRFWLEWLVQRRQGGATLAALADELTGAGVPTPGGFRQWTGSQVQRALRHTAVAGQDNRRTRRRDPNDGYTQHGRVA